MPEKALREYLEIQRSTPPSLNEGKLLGIVLIEVILAVLIIGTLLINVLIWQKVQEYHKTQVDITRLQDENLAENRATTCFLIMNSRLDLPSSCSTTKVKRLLDEMIANDHPR